MRVISGKIRGAITKRLWFIMDVGGGIWRRVMNHAQRLGEDVTEILTVTRDDK